MDALRGRTVGAWQSVALRFRHPLVHATRVQRQRGLRWGFSTAGPDDEIVAATGPYARDPDTARLEAVLLIAREPLPSRRLAQMASLADGTKARTLVRALNCLYDREGSAFRVEEVAGGLQLLSRPQFAPWLRRLQPPPIEVRLSAPAMETLAVVAYRQPVLRADVEAVRGVQCGEILRQLIERDLVRVAGRSEELGRPLLYATTKRFLQVFGLRNLEELPRAGMPRAGREPLETPTGSTPDRETGQSTPKAPVRTEENEVSRLSPMPSAEEDRAAVASQVVVPPLADAAPSDRDQFDDEAEDYEDEDEFDEDWEDEDEEEEEEEEDDFEDEPWEEVEDYEEEEDDEDEDDDWDDDWDDEDEDDEDL